MSTKIHKYIINKLKSKGGFCNISNKDRYLEDQISTPVLKNILTKKFNNGADMNAVVCMFDNIFSFSPHKNNSQGLYKLSTMLTKWIKKYKRLLNQISCISLSKLYLK